jgi:hypothetical protein
MKKNFYYKLGGKANSFYDPYNGLSVLPSKPGVCSRVGALTKKAASTGHIIPITEAEYLKLIGQPSDTASTDDTPAVENSTESEISLEEKLKALPGISTKKVKKVLKWDEDDIHEFIANYDPEEDAN